MKNLDLDKVRYAFEKVKETKDRDKIAEFAIETIPKLIEELRNCRMEVVNLLIKSK